MRAALRALAPIVLLAGCSGAPSGGDFDGDGTSDAEDCGPEDPEVHPAAIDLCGDGLDANCDGDDGDARSGPWCGGFLSTGGFSGCGIRADGQTVCWGDNNDGQGDAPQGISTLGVGLDFGCGLDAGGAIQCWGNGEGGVVDPPAGTWTELSVGLDHACVLNSEGAVACWGRDQLGSTVAPDGVFQKVVAGRAATCAIDAGGRLQCWGVGLDDPPTATGWTDLAAGFRYGCALDPNGDVACWGSGWGGLEAVPDGPFVALSGGQAHACALTADGVARCWGEPGLDATLDATFIADGDVPCVIGIDSRATCWGITLAGAAEPPN